MENKSMVGLLNLYARGWFDANHVVRLIRASGLTNIFPANLVSTKPFASNWLCIEHNDESGRQFDFFEKGHDDTWTWKSDLAESVTYSSAELVDAARLLSTTLPADYQPPEVLERHIWDMYFDFYPAVKDAVSLLLNDESIRVYPHVTDTPKTENPADVVVVSLSDKNMVIRPSVINSEASYEKVGTTRQGITLDEIKTFVLTA